MGYLIFLGVVIAGALAVLGLTRVTRGKGPVTPMVLLASPSGEMEATLWVQRLKDAGILVRSQETSLPAWQMGWGSVLGNRGYYSEIWVREKDYEAARDVLGFPRMRGG